MNSLFLLIMITFSLCILLYLDYMQLYPHRLIAKAVTSGLFVLLFISSYINNKFNTMYFIFILTALLFCFLGDVFLSIKTTNLSYNYFLLGLASFSCAHVFFSAGYIYISDFSFKILMITILISCISICFFKYSKLFDFKQMFLYISVYVILISIMIASSLQLTKMDSPMVHQVSFTIIGSILFLISDLILCINMFSKKEYKILGTINLILYYVGQILISTSMMT